MRHPKRKTTVGDSTRTSSPRWVDLQREIASCRKCREKWSKEITSPLSVGEIPDPPQKVKLLFVGVAPTPSRGKNKGNHFYSDVSDTLRVELFKMLDTLLENANLSHRNASSKEDGDSAFHGLSFFFVHAAKVRPITKSSPSHSAILLSRCDPRGPCRLRAFRRRYGRGADRRFSWWLFLAREGPPCTSARPCWESYCASCPTPCAESGWLHRSRGHAWHRSTSTLLSAPGIPWSKGESRGARSRLDWRGTQDRIVRVCFSP